MKITQKDTVDTNTGELLGSELTLHKTVKSDEFIQIYLEDMAGIMDLTSKSEFQVLAWLWKYSTYVEDDNEMVGNMVRPDNYIKSNIIKNTGFKEGTIRNIISNLANKRILIKDKEYRNVYYLNPKYFFKGKLSDRLKCYKYSVVYNIDNEEQVKESELGDININTSFENNVETSNY